MLYPNDIQAALLYDGQVDILAELARDFARMEGARTGMGFNMPEARPGVFYRLYGGDNLMVTLEYVDKPADVDLFRGTLSSCVTGMLCPDIRQRLMRNKSVVLVNVSHGVMGNAPEILELLAKLGRGPEGHSLPQFARRLEVAATIARMACDLQPAQAVHWTQSDQLIPGERFGAYAALTDAPNPLHIHPFLFGQQEVAGGEVAVGIRTFGARHFVGRELRVAPNVLPWSVNYEVMLTFLRVATTANGYIIPDGDTFGPEDRSCSYRVRHEDAEEGDVPMYVLEPLLYPEYGFAADGYVRCDTVIDDRAPPRALMPDDDEAKMDLVNEWREKRALAEGIGGRFELRVMGEDMPPTPPPTVPMRGVFGRRAVFGRKGV